MECMVATEDACDVTIQDAFDVTLQDAFDLTLLAMIGIGPDPNQFSAAACQARSMPDVSQQ